MNIHTLYTHDTRIALFTGAFARIRHCVEAAVAQKISLQNADLRHMDLSHASLDGADLRGADISASCLYGVNLSETNLTGATLSDCYLTLACLAESTLVDVDFSRSSFGGTILSGAHVADCVFSCPTALALPFCDARLGRNTYFHDGLTPLVFTTAPVVITGMPRSIVLLDDAVLIGGRVGKRPQALMAAVEDLYRSYA